jgi:putative flippase GtrA
MFSVILLFVIEQWFSFTVSSKARVERRVRPFSVFFFSLWTPYHFSPLVMASDDPNLTHWQLLFLVYDPLDQ